MNLLIKFPTRQRPEKFLKMLDLYLNLLEDKNKYEILVSCDTDDLTMNNPKMILEINSRKNCSVYFGDNKSKIEAVNADLDKAEPWDVLLLASDDMLPVYEGYDRLIRNYFKDEFPDTDGALWFNDGKVSNRLNTIACMGRAYFDRFGYIYHPSYKSLWCDNEYTEMGKKLNKLPYISTVIMTHIHPAWHPNTPGDALYDRNEALFREDEIMFVTRKKKGFPV